MTRSPAARLLAFVLALLSGFGPGALALAHGHAHEHLAEAHGGTHAADLAPHADEDTRSSSDVRVLDRDDHGHEHTHPSVDVVVSARADLRLDLAVAMAVVPPAALAPPTVRSLAARLLTSAPPRAGPDHGPPPPSRAPPLG